MMTATHLTPCSGEKEEEEEAAGEEQEQETELRV